jgi:hypothetical protein
MNIERFFSKNLSSPSAGFTSSSPSHSPSTLPGEVRQAANLGWLIFPVTPLAKLRGNPDLLIGEATCDVSRLEELAAEYPSCGWRVAIAPSSLCVLQIVGPEGRNSFAALSQDQGECLTLQARRGDTAWAYFRWPKGLLLRASAKKLAPSMRILAEGDSCPIPPSGGCAFANPWAEIEAVPCWLRELAFETPDNPPGQAVPVPAPSPGPAPCRSRAQFQKPQGDPRKGYPIYGQAGHRGGFRISRRR